MINRLSLCFSIFINNNWLRVSRSISFNKNSLSIGKLTLDMQITFKTFSQNNLSIDIWIENEIFYMKGKCVSRWPNLKFHDIIINFFIPNQYFFRSFLSLWLLKNKINLYISAKIALDEFFTNFFFQNTHKTFKNEYYSVYNDVFSK